MDLQAIAEQGRQSISREPPWHALTAFIDVMSQTRCPAPRPPRWWLSQAMRRDAGRCSYCGTDVRDAPALDPIIPLMMGGPYRPEAMVLCCKGCQRTRRQQDLLGWQPSAPANLQALRVRMAFQAWNHRGRWLTPKPSVDTVNAIIRQRWQQPRFHCHASLTSEGGFIGWRPNAHVPSSLALRLLLTHGGGRFQPHFGPGQPRRDGPIVIWIPYPAAAHEAIWDVIEHNGLVRSVAIRAAQGSLGDASNAWHDWMPMLPHAKGW